MRAQPGLIRASAIMTTYNGAPFVMEQIQSVLSQLGDNDELIISDDCSTDNTVSVIMSCKDSRIILLQNQCNVGVRENFSRLAEKARGEYILLSDQDDIWLPSKAEICLSALQTHSMVIHNGIFVDEDGKSMGRTLFEYRAPSLNYWSNLICNAYTGACMAFRRDFFTSALPIPPRIAMHDWYLAQRALKSGTAIKIVHEELIHYRRHMGNVSPTGARRSGNGLLKKLRWRWDLWASTRLDHVRNQPPGLF